MDSPTTDPAPIACSLSSVELGRREQTWTTLAAAALRAKIAIPNGVRLEFVADHDVAHALLDLVQAERECCGWASWSLSQTAAATVVEVRGDGPAVRAAQQLFDVA